MKHDTLQAGDGLALVMEGDAWRISWGAGSDWLGPVGLALRGKALSPQVARDWHGHDDLGAYRGLELEVDSGLPLRFSVRAYRERALLVFRSEATERIRGQGTGEFEKPWLCWPWLQPARRRTDGLPEGSCSYGHHYSEFALPSFSDTSLATFFLIPAPRRPAVVMPLWLNAPDGGSLMLAPLDAFHEQVIGVPRGRERADEGVSCGWHGDLDEIPAGFASELALWAGPGPRALLDTHCALLRERHRTRRPSRYADTAVGKLSYWTDNGAAYWYRTAPGLDLPTTLERTLAGLREQHVPVDAVELDSWWYPHEITRPVNLTGQTIVPPTGMLAWEPRDDVLPEGMEALRQRLGSPPLILHSRHFSSASSYFDELEAWRDADRAHPVGPELFERLIAQAATWGAVQYEQDWLVESFLGVRGLRAAPGRARAWQEALDAAAARHGLTLLWCMATPADFFQTLTLERVTSIRTSGDYRYLIGNAALWAWYLYGNAFARALGLNTFKDVFLSMREGSGLDGDPHAEIEALLAVLGAGPVGIGDRLERSDPSLIARTCRSDGVLLKPDAPVAALDRCFRAHVHLQPNLLVAETHSDHGLLRWSYVVSLHAWRGEEAIAARVALGDLGREAPKAAVLSYDWRSGDLQRLEPDEGWDLRLEPRSWDYRVLAPILPGEIALIGDPEVYATAADRRLRRVRSVGKGVAFELLGAPGERVRLLGWSARELELVKGDARFSRDAATGRFELSLEIPARGWHGLELA